MMVKINSEYVKNMRKNLKENRGLSDEQVDFLLQPHSFPTGRKAILKRLEGDGVGEVG